MKNYLKKFLGIALVSAMALTMLTACGKEKATEDAGGNTATTAPEATKAPEKEPEAAPTEEPARDLNGMEVIVGNWWEQDPPPPPKTQQEEDTLAFREEFMEKHNFTIATKNLGTWGEYQEIMITSTMAGAPAADVFIMDAGFMAAPLQQGLLYPLNTLSSFDFSEEKWNQEVVNMMTFGETIYGMKAGRLEPRLGLFFNKRLLEDAGIDPELPYDLQAKDEWTWAAFEDMLKKTTRDTNNDGTPDTYGLASFSVDYFKAAIYSNGASVIDKDENGKFINATGSANCLEALQWSRGLYDQGYTMPQPEGSNWDWFMAAFKDSNVAFTAAEQYKVGTWAEMADDWGFVMFPKGPQGTLTTVFNENITVMPAGMDPAKAEDVAFAYDLLSNDTPGYEDADFRTNYYPSFRDTRAVDETLPLFYEPGHGVMNLMTLVDGVDFGEIAYGLDGGTATPVEQVEKVQGLWQTFIDAANGDGQ